MRDVRRASGAALLAAGGGWFAVDMVTRRTVVDGSVQSRADYRLWYAAVVVVVAIVLALSRSWHRERTRDPSGLVSLIVTLLLYVGWIPLLISPVMYVAAYLDESDAPGPVFVERPFNYFRGLFAILLISAAAWTVGRLLGGRESHRPVAARFRGNVRSRLREIGS